MKKRKAQHTDFGQRLKHLRCQRKLTGIQIATELGVSPSTYRDWEYGRAVTGQPYQDLARILGVSLNELFGIEKSDTEKKQNELVHLIASIEALLHELRTKVKE